MPDKIEEIDWGGVLTWTSGCTLGILGSIPFEIIKGVGVDILDNIVKIGKWGWGIASVVSAIASVLAVDAGLKQEDLLAKSVLLGFGTSQAHVALANLLILSIVEEFEKFEPRKEIETVKRLIDEISMRLPR